MNVPPLNSNHLSLADIQVPANNNGLPGMSAFLKIVGALITFGFLAAVAGIVIGAIVWSLGSHNANAHHADRGKLSVLVSSAAAVLVGSAVGIVNFFSHVHLA